MSNTVTTPTKEEINPEMLAKNKYKTPTIILIQDSRIGHHYTQ